MIKEQLKTSLGRFRIVAFLEGCSYLAFALTMPLKYGFDIPQPNYVVGMAHGVLFMAYVIMAVQLTFEEKWKLTKAFWVLLASLIPFGTFYMDAKLFKERG